MNIVVNDDCFKYLDEIEDESVDLVLIDPPYHISRNSGFVQMSEKTDPIVLQKYGKLSIDFGDWDKVDIDWIDIFKSYYRVLKNGGTIIIFYDIWKSSVIKEAAEINNFKQPRVCQWLKTNPVPINSSKNYLSNSSEYFFTFIKDKNPTFNSKYDSGIYKYPLCHGNERFDHPTQKPLALISELVKKHSNVGDVVLDTFAGTGTTGEACLLNNRNFILVEKNEDYFKIIKNRLKLDTTNA